MWIWRSFLCVSVVCGLALDSNTIRSSKEQQGSELPRGGCSNRAQRRPSSQDRHVDRQVDRQVDRHVDRQRDTETDTLYTDGFNRTKAPEMSSCVRSGDCAAGLCCVRYLTGKRCQRIPVEGEACLLRGSTKLRRKLGRCDCDAGLSCTAVSRVETGTGKAKGQGVCTPRQREGQRKTRHSGKNRRTAESSC
ncbi:hypothetical protein PBY51_003517 [Eleginops maclovinus]|uniref:Dickkopf-related protein 1/2/4 C-terminal subdomain 1 domain-containing protein n=1 Tax=Eleginops maclovinus TaxID=56733 RepID=A0AAN8APS5_ELEMC|nr:hypothetical protein PBY51_003517 [Eleginops maclovinus]